MGENFDHSKKNMIEAFKIPEERHAHIGTKIFEHLFFGETMTESVEATMMSEDLDSREKMFIIFTLGWYARDMNSENE